MSLYSLESLFADAVLDALDVRFAQFLANLQRAQAPDKPVTPVLLLSAALVSCWTRRGHICLDLVALAEQPLPLEIPPQNGRCPALADWQAALHDSPLVQPPGAYAPLILADNQRLYLHRYWAYEQALSQHIVARLAQGVEDLDETALQDSVQRLFPATATQPDWQKIAVLIAAQQKFCVISGGPGTGKTTTVVKLLAVLLEQAPKPLRIALLAPTGKAAMRLQEALTRQKQSLPCSAAIKQSIPEETATIHRFLGYQPNALHFRFNASNLAPVDLVVVDEASMVDLALMSKLLQALPARARLILLGDKDQLSSVEAGAVLGDLCAHSATGGDNRFSPACWQRLERLLGQTLGLPAGDAAAPPMQNAVVVLQHSYRFGNDSPIGQLARAINAGKAAHALRLLHTPTVGQQRILWFNHADPYDAAVIELIIQGFTAYLHAADAQQALEHFDQFRVLCAHRQGELGVVKLNQLIEKLLIHAGKLPAGGRRARWYVGQPLMITQNDYNLRLFNGDIGIVLPDPQQSQRRLAFFRTAEQQIRSFLPTRLPQHETAYAMTIHKSQGSEFEQVLLVLPDSFSPVLSRELLYTGLTRAKQSVAVLAGAAVLSESIQRRALRSSGLRQSIWQTL